MARTIVGFDFDQTLADSTTGIENCLLHVSCIYGVETESDLLTNIARSGLKLEPMLREFISEEQLPLAVRTFLEIYPQVGIAGTRIMGGAVELIQKLRDAKCRLILISAKSQNNLLLSLKHLNLEFDEVYGGASGQEKTDYIIKSKTQVYIGDQESDVVAATKAGAKAVLVNQTPPSFNQNDYPYEYFSNLSELFGSIDLIIHP
jgi:phosphoglycolate phosphatase